MSRETYQDTYEEPTVYSASPQDQDPNDPGCGTCQTTCTLGNQVCRPINQ